MPRLHAIAVAVVLAFTPGAVCTPTDGEPDGSVPDASPPDGATDVDGGVADDGGVLDGATEDAAVDGSTGDQGDPPADASVDLAVMEDAGPCGMECVASDPCRTASCDLTTGSCVEVVALEDGATCGETDAFICVEGTCEARGCGDGYRERGDGTWPREGCDDHNMLDGDICNVACEPTEFVPRVDPGTEEFSVRFSATGNLLVVDGLGNGLLVWVQHHIAFGEERQELRASRIDPYGNFLDLGEPLLFDVTTQTAFDMTPSAVGLTSGGFVVTWTARRTVEGLPALVLLMRSVGVGGQLGDETNIHPPMIGAQRWPAMAATTDGFVVVWQDDGAQSDVWGRRFRDNGMPMTTVMGLATTTAGGQSAPSVAAVGNEWLVTFLSQSGSVITSPVEVRGRRFAANGPLGNDFPLVGANAASQSVAAIGADYVLAYSSNADDAKGDLYVMGVPRMAGEALGMPMALDTAPLTGAADARIAAYGPRETGAFVVVYHDNQPIPAPLFISVGLTPPSEVDSLLLMTRGERFPVVAAAPYELTGGSVWFGYTAQVSGGHVGAVVFQLPPL